jgi:hypothetical protein
MKMKPKFCSSRGGNAHSVKAEMGNRKSEMNQRLVTSSATFQKRVASGLCPDNFTGKPGFSGHRPDATAFGKLAKSSILPLFGHFARKLSFFDHGVNPVRRRLNSVGHELNSVGHELNPVRHGLNSVCRELNPVDGRLNPVGLELKSVRRGLNPVWRKGIQSVTDWIQSATDWVQSAANGSQSLTDWVASATGRSRFANKAEVQKGGDVPHFISCFQRGWSCFPAPV